MPYNNTPIPRPENNTGANYLPLARVQKIINADDDVESCSKNAAFAIAIAAEEFIWYLVEQTQTVAKASSSSGRGNRKASTLTYQDIANAVARIENLEFLTDVVPRTTKYRDFVAMRERKKEEAANKSNGLAPGQRTLDGSHKAEGEMEGVEPTSNVNGILNPPVGAEDHRPSTAGGRPSFDAVRDEFVSPEST